MLMFACAVVGALLGIAAGNALAAPAAGAIALVLVGLLAGGTVGNMADRLTA